MVSKVMFMPWNKSRSLRVFALDLQASAGHNRVFTENSHTQENCFRNTNKI